MSQSFEDTKQPLDHESSRGSPVTEGKPTLATELAFTASEEKSIVRKLGTNLLSFSELSCPNQDRSHPSNRFPSFASCFDYVYLARC